MSQSDAVADVTSAILADPDAIGQNPGSQFDWLSREYARLMRREAELRSLANKASVRLPSEPAPQVPTPPPAPKWSDIVEQD